MALVAAVLGGVVSLAAAKAIGLTDEKTISIYVPTVASAGSLIGAT